MPQRVLFALAENLGPEVDPFILHLCLRLRKGAGLTRAALSSRQGRACRLGWRSERAAGAHVDAIEHKRCNITGSSAQSSRHVLAGLMLSAAAFAQAQCGKSACCVRRGGGLETWHGRDAVTLANERARQRGTQTSTYTGAPVLDPYFHRGRSLIFHCSH